MATVYCRTTGHNVHSFYIRTGREEYFLFSQDYYGGVHDYFAGGVNLKGAMDCSRGRHDRQILRTMNKIPKYISYIEKEYGAVILDKTRKQRERKGLAWAN